MGGTERATAAARQRCRRAAAIRSEWQKLYLKLRFSSSWPLCRDRGAYFSYLGMYKQRGKGANPSSSEAGPADPAMDPAMSHGPSCYWTAPPSRAKDRT